MAYREHYVKGFGHHCNNVNATVSWLALVPDELGFHSFHSSVGFRSYRAW